MPILTGTARSFLLRKNISSSLKAKADTHICKGERKKKSGTQIRLKEDFQAKKEKSQDETLGRPRFQKKSCALDTHFEDRSKFFREQAVKIKYRDHHALNSISVQGRRILWCCFETLHLTTGPNKVLAGKRGVSEEDEAILIIRDNQSKRDVRQHTLFP